MSEPVLPAPTERKAAVWFFKYDSIPYAELDVIVDEILQTDGSRKSMQEFTSRLDMLGNEHQYNEQC
jgi:hypothetical protein